MSRAPQIIRSPRTDADFRQFREGGAVEDSMLTSLNHDLAVTNTMLTADEYGHRHGVTRGECDEFAELSHARARAANRVSHFNGGERLKGMFAIGAVDRTSRPVHMARDECVRKTSFDVLAALRRFTPHKFVSPGNASEISDGAAALLIADRKRADELGLPGRYAIAGYGVAGVDPWVMDRGPVPSIQQALARTGIEQSDVGLWEINAAFAAQYLGVEKELKLDREITNVNGGAIALGHPLAATGGRLLVDLMHEMQHRGVRYGCASACIGGGQGVAVIKRINEARRVAVIGAGTMGQGIAIDLLLKTDYELILLDVQTPGLNRARQKLERLRPKQVVSNQIRPEDAKSLESPVTYTD